MSDLNRTILIGRLVRSPELRYTQGGTSVASFTIANNRSYTQNGEKKELTSFFNCIAWGKLGETMAQLCKKGQRIGVEGQLRQQSWEDQNGNKRSAVEVVAENFQFLSPKDQGTVADHNPTTSSEPVQPHTSDPDKPGTNGRTHSGMNLTDHLPFDDLPVLPDEGL